MIDVQIRHPVDLHKINEMPEELEHRESGGECCERLGNAALFPIPLPSTKALPWGDDVFHCMKSDPEDPVQNGLDVRLQRGQSACYQLKHEIKKKLIFSSIIRGRAGQEERVRMMKSISRNLRS
eukprot:TRINITY_DN11942_c0_g1_i2.p2 TRINITY_DN11942_c0_g1~~TRINITY_DN11942_c0_g1_i2.p2  ORF type:complete len:124 (+),score=1.04 TRINITY_DN11942_c0_g1_i2:61-432(+)